MKKQIVLSVKKILALYLFITTKQKNKPRSCASEFSGALLAGQYSTFHLLVGSFVLCCPMRRRRLRTFSKVYV